MTIVSKNIQQRMQEKSNFWRWYQENVGPIKQLHIACHQLSHKREDTDSACDCFCHRKE